MESNAILTLCIARKGGGRMECYLWKIEAAPSLPVKERRWAGIRVFFKIAIRIEVACLVICAVTGWLLLPDSS